MASKTVFVNQFTNGILGPDESMLGPVEDGGVIIANTAPGCWGPMLTPAIRGGHEVTRPVQVEGAEPGDSIAIRILSINVTSRCTASGNDTTFADRFLGDPYVAGKCPQCGTLYEETCVEGTGPECVKCAKCGAPAAPFAFTNGYTIAFNDKGTLGVTLNKEAAQKAADDARENMCIPDNSIQNPVVAMAPSDLPGLVARMIPFVGQLGVVPVRNTPDSHNARDLGSFLVDAPHEYGITQEQLDDVTDGHMDINRVRAGAVLIAPVRVPGGGVYVGDMHAMQGDGEIAGHTADVSGVVTMQVSVLKGVTCGGPIILPVYDDLPLLARPLNDEEKHQAMLEAEKWGVALEESAPISFVGSGPTLNDATSNALTRAAEFLDCTVPEVMNRATITGNIQIGRAPGTVTATFLAPTAKLREKGVYDLIRTQYGL
ncbi:acetamidase/formamidase family protein [Pseudodesulfovibrio thermohalotolerans]|uniref:acetamidase/formamidase family protein n=1 Tax=Pseudodesulfovibrio thermohalotolerans TaxID=2880651 RepID=UPI0024427CC7|nr:acetamidase/formamidase family protein [Pseudodesulfovibrio thermohalotolerans]WFS62099.1 acetamidase/formamidase family protein [Pseudodesulfovibrio thermohalotolerans]